MSLDRFNKLALSKCMDITKSSTTKNLIKFFKHTVTCVSGNEYVLALFYMVNYIGRKVVVPIN